MGRSLATNQQESQDSMAPSLRQRRSGAHRLRAFALAATTSLLLLGPFVVPSSFAAAAGWGALLGALSMQAALALLALIGPLALAKYPRTIRVSLGFG